MKNHLLITFVRNPELGKVKTRLAQKIGDSNALEVYIDLLEHTKSTMLSTTCQKAVFYSEHIPESDMWSKNDFLRFAQHGNHLGERMAHAFQIGFGLGFSNIVLIWSDLPTLKATHVTEAFERLKNCDAVIGPAQDGGYYLIGMTQYHQVFFNNKTWGTSSVLEQTLNETKGLKVDFIETLNDIDTFEDMEGLKKFKKLYDEYK